MDSALNLFTGAFIGGIISSIINLYLWPAIVLGVLLCRLRKLAVALGGLWAAGVTGFHSKLMHSINMANPEPAAMAADYAAAILVGISFALAGTVLGEELLKKRKTAADKYSDRT